MIQDQQFNILAITNSSGRVQERYEYTPYGQQICLSTNDDLLAMSPFSHVERKWVGSAIQPYSRNPFGFQGLYHDEESTLIYNRAHMLNTKLSRFNQRDPLGYPDGMNTYAAYHVLYGGVDPWGMSWLDNDYNNTRKGMTRKSITIDTPWSDKKKYGYEPHSDSTPQDGGWYETREVSTHGEIRDHLERQADALGTTVSEQAYRELVQALYNSKSGKLDLLDYACGDKSQEMENLKLQAQGMLELLDEWGASGAMDVETARQIEQDIQEGNIGKAVGVILTTAAGKALLDKIGGRFFKRCNPKKTPDYEGPSPKIDPGKQGKHVPGHNNHIPGRSKLTADPDKLGRRAGTGQQVGDIPVGKPGSRERVDFGETIGDFVDRDTGVATPTTNGIIHYAKDGIHIVPARP